MADNDVKSNSYKTIGVVGAGSWGTALALVAAQAGRNVVLWAREPDVVSDIRAHAENRRFLSGITLAKEIAATGELRDVGAADALLVVVPAQHLRATLTALSPHLKAQTPVVVCAKGIERDTGLLVNEVLAAAAPDADAGILSGPSFAHDVARHKPTAVTIAARIETAQRMQMSLGHLTFRPYASDDVVGVALGGAAKNVYAIACGIVAGMGLGESARAALLARSFAELVRLGEALGAKRDTLMGLSGLGDLVLTATSATSRNYALGLALGEGGARDALLAPGRPLAEGAATAPALVARARRENVELPIAEAVMQVLDGTLSLADVIPRLMSRPLKPE